MTDPERFSAGTNNGPRSNMKEFMEKGSYNVLMDVPELEGMKQAWQRDRYEVDAEFINAMKNFSWEVLQVYSPPPVIGFSWRHWGNFTGKWQGNQGDGQLVELFGFSIVDITGGKLGRFENFFDAKSFVQVLRGEKSADELKQPNSAEIYPQIIDKRNE